MARLVCFTLTSALALAAGNGFVCAADYRIDPDATRRAEISITLPEIGLQAAAAHGTDAVKTGLPREYASAMTWYRVALADGYTQPPLVASPWARDEQLPEPLQWTWVADNGDLITRAGKGLFRLSLANDNNNWFQDVDCRLTAWPEGNTEAPMACNDGVARTMRIPGDGIVLVDDVQYTRVFNSDATTLPPEEVINVDELTAAAIKASGLSPEALGAAAPKTAAKPALGAPADAALEAATLALPDQAPIPPARQQAQAPAARAPVQAPAAPAQPSEQPSGLY